MSAIGEVNVIPATPITDDIMAVVSQQNMANPLVSLLMLVLVIAIIMFRLLPIFREWRIR